MAVPRPTWKKTYIQFKKSQNNVMQMKIGYTYLSHDHDLVPGQVMLFDCLSKNNFGMSVRIYLIKVRRLNLVMKRKQADLTHIGCIKSIDSCIITCQMESSSKPNCDKQNFYLYLRCLDVLDRFLLW